MSRSPGFVGAPVRIEAWAVCRGNPHVQAQSAISVHDFQNRDTFQHIAAPVGDFNLPRPNAMTASDVIHRKIARTGMRLNAGRRDVGIVAAFLVGNEALSVADVEIEAQRESLRTKKVSVLYTA